MTNPEIEVGYPLVGEAAILIPLFNFISLQLHNLIRPESVDESVLNERPNGGEPIAPGYLLPFRKVASIV